LQRSERFRRRYASSREQALGQRCQPRIRGAEVRQPRGPFRRGQGAGVCEVRGHWLLGRGTAIGRLTHAGRGGTRDRQGGDRPWSGFQDCEWCQRCGVGASLGRVYAIWGVEAQERNAPSAVSVG
jgi:hypothetical protein